jgi:hypothetical protein
MFCVIGQPVLRVLLQDANASITNPARAKATIIFFMIIF